MFVPLIIMLSTVRVVSVPRDVILPCAAVANVPVNVPVTVKLSLIVVSDVVCPIDTAIPETASPIFNTPVLFLI